MARMHAGKTVRRLRGWLQRHPDTVAWICVAALACVHSLGNIHFIGVETIVPFTDQHASRAGELYVHLSPGGGGDLPRYPFPPLVYLVTYIFFHLFGLSLKSALWSQQFFTLLFVPAVYGVGRSIGGRTGGLVAAFLASSSPLVLNASRGYFLDYPQTALAALALLVLLGTDGYRSERHSWALGIALGAALLTKWSSLFFLAVPLLWYLAPSLVRAVRGRAGRGLLGWTAIYLGWTIWRLLEFLWFRLAEAPSGGWATACLWQFLLPGVVYLAGIRLWLHRTPASEAKEVGTATLCLANFLRATTAMFLVVIPWALYAGEAITAKWLIDTEPIVSFGDAMHAQVKMVANHFSFCPLLLLGSVLHLAFFRRASSARLFWLVALGAPMLLLVLLRPLPDPRYSLTLVVFSSVVVGGGIGSIPYRGLKLTCAAVLALLSLLSVVGWAIVPAGLLHPITRDKTDFLLWDNAYGMAILTGDLPRQTLELRANAPRVVAEAVERQPGIDSYDLLEEDVRWIVARLTSWDSAGILKINRLELLDSNRFFSPPICLADMLLAESMRHGRVTASLTLVDDLLGQALTGYTLTQHDLAWQRVPRELLVVQARHYLVLHEPSEGLDEIRSALAYQSGGEPDRQAALASTLGFQITLWQFPAAADGPPLLVLLPSDDPPREDTDAREDAPPPP